MESARERQGTDKGAPEEARLWVEYGSSNSVAAREALFAIHIGLARSVARRLWQQGVRADVDLADFEQLAFEGLLQAMERYDPERGVPFRAFAGKRITGNVLDGIARMTEAREQLSAARRIRRERIRSLAGEMEASNPQDELEILSELALGLALGFMLEDSGLARSEETAPAGAAAFSAWESAAWRELTGALSDELAGLEERERTVLGWHYIHGLPFDQLASVMGISKGRVSQLHKAALMRLRKRLSARGHIRLEGQGHR